MKQLILTIAVLLQLIFFAACNSSKNPDANVPSATPAASTATITASPNPVSIGEGPGTTTITWSTGDGTAGQVYVSVDGEPETLFGSDASGSVPAPWIKAGKMYEFRLYAGTQHATVLAKTQVTGQK
jgi:ABC-type Fe3+-hydroxamate transport system substrate-binding protein